jgi:hypothetical protein
MPVGSPLETALDPDSPALTQPPRSDRRGNCHDVLRQAMGRAADSRAAPQRGPLTTLSMIDPRMQDA